MKVNNKLKCFGPTEMLLRQKDPKVFTIQTLRNEFKTSIKNEDGQLRAKTTIYNKKSKRVKNLIKKKKPFGHWPSSVAVQVINKLQFPLISLQYKR